MGETIRETPVCDIAISLCAKTPGNNDIERQDFYDILAVRRADTFVGGRDVHQVLWIRMQGWDWNYMSGLTEPMYDPPQKQFEGEVPEDAETVAKRRYCIPVSSLKVALPDFDEAEALDPLKLYQPWLDVEEHERTVMTSQGPRVGTYYLFTHDGPAPLSPDGLIYDKQTEAFIYG